MLPLKKDLRLVRSLHQKKFRFETKLFAVEGLKMVEEAIQSKIKVHTLYTTDAAFAQRHKGSILITNKEMDQISFLSQPPGYLCVLYQMDLQWKAVPSENSVLILDGISDPGNMGTIIRTADWFGFRSIFCTSDCVELFNPKVVQATMGSVFRMNISYGDIAQAFKELTENGYLFWGADLSGENLYSAHWPEKVVIIIGSESHGLRGEARAKIDARISIPGIQGSESLNASVAASIIMSERFRNLD